MNERLKFLGWSDPVTAPEYEDVLVIVGLKSVGCPYYHTIGMKYANGKWRNQSRILLNDELYEVFGWQSLPRFQ